MKMKTRKKHYTDGLPALEPLVARRRALHALTDRLEAGGDISTADLDTLGVSLDGFLNYAQLGSIAQERLRARLLVDIRAGGYNYTADELERSRKWLAKNDPESVDWSTKESWENAARYLDALVVEACQK